MSVEKRTMFGPFAEAGTGRKRFIPVPTNPSAITCRRFFNKKKFREK